jgi:hypothetical protein
LSSRFARHFLRGESMSMRSLSKLGDAYVAVVADPAFVAALSRTTSCESAIDTPSMMTLTTLGEDSALADSVFCNFPRTVMLPSC